MHILKIEPSRFNVPFQRDTKRLPDITAPCPHAAPVMTASAAKPELFALLLCEANTRLCWVFPKLRRQVSFVPHCDHGSDNVHITARFFKAETEKLLMVLVWGVKAPTIYKYAIDAIGAELGFARSWSEEFIFVVADEARPVVVPCTKVVSAEKVG